MKILPLSKLKISDLVKQLKKDSNIFGKNSLLNDLFWILKKIHQIDKKQIEL